MDPRLIHHMGHVYYTSQNNGLFAIADELTYQTFKCRQKVEAIESFLKQATAKEKSALTVFVFGGDYYRCRRDKWLVGTAEMFFRLIELLRENCAIVIDVGNEMYVPFSNGDRPNQDEVHLIRRESEFREVFGLTPQELSGRKDG